MKKAVSISIDELDSYDGNIEDMSSLIEDCPNTFSRGSFLGEDGMDAAIKLNQPIAAEDVPMDIRNALEGIAAIGK